MTLNNIGVFVARRKPLRHRLHALAIARTDQPCNIKMG
jgi:hypothetical protein